MNPPLSPAQTRTYTARNIAIRLGVKRQTIQSYQDGVTPDEVLIVNGLKTNAWFYGSLAQALRGRIEDAARTDGIASAEEFLLVPARRYELPAPLSQWHPDEIMNATKLKRAFEGALDRELSGKGTSAEREELGIRDYACIFGFRISSRYFRHLLNRTIVRDAGRHEWDRVEIYLPDRMKLRLAVPQQLDDGEALLEEIRDVITQFGKPCQPTETECDRLWQLSKDHLTRCLNAGHNPKKSRKGVLRILWAEAPFMAKSFNALRMAFDRRLPKRNLVDGRRQKAGIATSEPIPDSDKVIIQAKALFETGGRIRQALRELRKEGAASGLTEPTLVRLNGRRSEDASKSYENRPIATALKRSVDNMAPFVLGKKAIDDNTASVQRDYSKLASMQCITGDDFTLPVYSFYPHKSWFNLTRGQCLLFADCRSNKILGRSLQTQRNYNSLVIRTLDNRVCKAQNAIPAVKMYENCIWKARVVVNAAPVQWDSALSWPEHDFGWEQLGVRIHHCRKARSKPAETIGRLLQNLMERVPGYCGRDERYDCPEKTKRDKLAVEAKRAEPYGLFLSFDDWEKELDRLTDLYNDDPQDGILDGLSPNQAFEQFWPKDDPPTPYDGKHWHLFAHYVSKRRVGTEGITFTIGKERFTYRSELTSALRGEEVLAWFDPEFPEFLGVTDLDQHNPIIIERANSVHFLAMLDENSKDYQDLQHELQKAEGHNKYWRARYHAVEKSHKLKSRTAAVSPAVAEVGDAFTAERSRLQIASRDSKHRSDEARRAFAKLNSQVPPDCTPEQTRAAEKLARWLSKEGL